MRVVANCHGVPHTLTKERGARANNLIESHGGRRKRRRRSKRERESENEEEEREEEEEEARKKG